VRSDCARSWKFQPTAAAGAIKIGRFLKTLS
jgi:hypothetical protein